MMAVGHRITDARSQARRMVGASAVYRTGAFLRRAARAAWLTRSWKRLRHWTVHSWLVRWLTAEPDPEVIVIDLRETVTVGPLIALFDWIIRWLGRRFLTSRTARLFAAIHRRLQVAPVRITSGVTLLAVSAYASYGAVAEPLGVLGWALLTTLFVLAFGGLFVDASWREVKQSRAGEWVAQAVAPPEPIDREA